MEQKKFLNDMVIIIICILLTSLINITVETDTFEDKYIKKGCNTKLRLQKLDVDYIIVGFVPVHVLGDKEYKTNNVAITWSLAIAFAIEEINKDETILPGIKLGYEIRDTCNENALAVKYLLEFMLEPEYFRPKLHLSKQDDLCIARNSSYSIVAGVVGGASSSISSIISNVLSADFIPQVSYSATSAVLSDRHMYRSFSRTVPSDVYQADAIADLLDYFGWTYVSAFASDDEYGRLGLDELRDRTRDKNICLATDKTFEPVLTKEGINEIMDILVQYNHTSHIVILWCQRTNALRIIAAAESLRIVNITWIGTETWGTSPDVLGILTGNIIGLELYKPVIKSFPDFLANSHHLNCENPWYRQFAKGIVPFPCEMATFVGKLLPDKKYPQVIASVYALAHSLHKSLGCSKLKNCTKSGKLNYQDVYENMKGINFTVPRSTYNVVFDDEGESLVKTYQFKFWNKRKEEFSSIGSWNGKGTLKINESAISWGNSGKPIGQCSTPCSPGSYKINSSSDCCWSCAKCAVNSISTRYNQVECIKCSNKNQIANLIQTSCINLKELHLTFDSQIGIIIIVLSCVGVTVTAIILSIFFFNWDTPMIKSSSREMSCLQLGSLLLLFCIPALYMLKLTVFVCSIRLSVFGFLFTTVVAIIVTKTYRLLCVFSERFTKVSKFLHNKYQITFTYVIVFLQVLVTALWFSNFPPVISQIIDRENRTIYTECGYHETVAFWFILGYVFVLAVTSGYMAFRARKLPENFSETQYICFAMFIACILWIMFIPLYLSLNAIDGTVAFLAINFTCMLCILLVLYGYKIGIILFYPDLNSPEHFRKTAAKATISQFKRDVDGRSRYQSVITFDIMDSSNGVTPPRQRRLSVQYTDFPDAIEMDTLIEEPVQRRASFSGIGELERSIKKHIIPIDTLRTRMSKMKKSQSTPLIFDGGSSPTPSRTRPFSQLMGRLASATSLNRIFTDQKGPTSHELKALIDEETIV